MDPRLLKWLQPVVLVVVLTAGAAWLIWLQNRPPDPLPAFLPMPQDAPAPTYSYVSASSSPTSPASSEDQVPGGKGTDAGPAAGTASSSVPAADSHADDWQQHLATPAPSPDSTEGASTIPAAPSGTGAGSGGQSTP